VTITPHSITTDVVNADRVKRFRDSNSRASRSSCWRTTPADPNALRSGEMTSLRRHVEALAARLRLRRPKIRRQISTLIRTDLSVLMAVCASRPPELPDARR